jgi:hypothetical protein
MTPALFSALLLLVGGTPELTPDEGIRTVVEVAQRNAGIRSYTFSRHVNVVVHAFPEVRFHLDGQGE